jgi:hypothetical protein
MGRIANAYILIRRLINEYAHKKGGESVNQEIPSKTIYHGKTKIVIHSPLMGMTEDEQEKWFEDEWKKGNPILKQIVEAAWKCLEG